MILYLHEKVFAIFSEGSTQHYAIVISDGIPWSGVIDKLESAAMAAVDAVVSSYSGTQVCYCSAHYNST